MKLLFVVLICAFVFLVCFLIDTLFKLIFPKSKLEKSKQVVRPPRRSAVIGVILTFAGVAMLVKNLAGTPDTLFLIGSAVAVIFGVLLLCTYFSVVIYYDDEGFLYKAWGHGKKEFRYSQIKGQRSLLTRGGVNTILFVGNEEINLYSAMQNLNAFLSKAFFKWCAAKGIDPDTIENNPRMATYFPDPDDVSGFEISFEDAAFGCDSVSSSAFKRDSSSEQRRYERPFSLSAKTSSGAACPAARQRFFVGGSVLISASSRAAAAWSSA